MIIDFHTHAFNDKIAAIAIERLETTGGTKSYSDGTIKSYLEYLENCGIDMGVLLPIATKPSQQTIINDWVVLQDGKRIVPFGSIHPHADDALFELERIKSLGLKGIKLHPDYQEFFVDEQRYFPIYEKCVQLGLVIVFHTGYDPISPDLTHATPQRMLTVLKKFPKLKTVLAHLGGMYHFDEVERLLAGISGEVYFDTAYLAGECEPEQLLRIIKKHGADRILFASDFPWHQPEKEIALINSLDLSDDDKEKIFYKNAIRLLKLEF